MNQTAHKPGRPVSTRRAQAPSAIFNSTNETRMNAEARNEFDVNYDNRIRKIREAAATAIRQLDQLRSATIAPEVLDAQVARIAQENLYRYGCDLIVQRTADGATRFLIKVQSTGRRYDLIKSFFHRHDRLIPSGMSDLGS